MKRILQLFYFSTFNFFFDRVGSQRAVCATCHFLKSAYVVQKMRTFDIIFIDPFFNVEITVQKWNLDQEIYPAVVFFFDRVGSQGGCLRQIWFFNVRLCRPGNDNFWHNFYKPPFQCLDNLKKVKCGPGDLSCSCFLFRPDREPGGVFAPHSIFVKSAYVVQKLRNFDINFTEPFFNV